MKKIIFFILLVLFSGCEKKSLVFEGNVEKKPLDFKLGIVQCPQCHMETLSLTNTAQAVMEDGKTYIFDDAGCLVLWINEHHVEIDKTILWVYANDSKHYIDAHKAQYRLGERTPMGYGFGIYEKAVENSISFEKMRLKMLRGENMTNPKIRKKFSR